MHISRAVHIPWFAVAVALVIYGFYVEGAYPAGRLHPISALGIFMLTSWIGASWSGAVR